MRLTLHTQWGETYIDTEEIIEIKANHDIYGNSVVVYEPDTGNFMEQIVKERPEEIRKMIDSDLS